MDALSHILDGLAMRGSLYFPAEFRAAWGLRVAADTNVCRFHVVVEGGLHVTAENECLELGRGDLVLVPQGREHLLQDDPATPVTDLDRALAAQGYDGRGAFRWGEEGAVCRLVCGHFEFDREAAHPLLEALPTLIHVRATPTYEFGWIDQVMRFIGEETRQARPGSDLIARRLSEVLFVQVVRHFAETSPDPAPLLTGLTDPRLGRALRALHSRLDRSWTVEELAAEAGMSRTAFAVRFGELLGSPPMRYLTAERMREAARRLRAGETTAATADRVGYRSEAAFARKFKAAFGLGPGAYRRAGRGA